MMFESKSPIDLINILQNIYKHPKTHIHCHSIFKFIEECSFYLRNIDVSCVNKKTHVICLLSLLFFFET